MLCVYWLAMQMGNLASSKFELLRKSKLITRFPRNCFGLNKKSEPNYLIDVWLMDYHFFPATLNTKFCRNIFVDTTVPRKEKF